MPYCANCGTAGDGRFCPKCGAAMGSAGPPPPPYPPPPPPPGYSQPLRAPGLAANVASTLCYVIPVVCPIIFLVVEPYKNDRSIRFNAYQSLFLWAAFIVLSIGISILVMAMWQLYFLHAFLSLLELAVTIYCAYKAFQNEKAILPFVGPLAEKQA